MPSWSTLSQRFIKRSVIPVPQSTQENLEDLQDFEELLTNIRFFIHEAKGFSNGLEIIIEGIHDVRHDLFFMGLALEEGIESFLSSFTIDYRTTKPDHSPITFAVFPSSSSLNSNLSFDIAPHQPLAPLSPPPIFLPPTRFTSDDSFDPMRTYGKYE